MTIYGTALLAICLLTGIIVGKLIGMAIGVDANVGGVGLAMLLLIVLSGALQKSGHLPKPTQGGILFWSSVYIPIVVAMAASQNVRTALRGGPVAILAGVVVVIVSFALVPILSQVGKATPRPDSDTEDGNTEGGDE